MDWKDAVIWFFRLATVGLVFVCVLIGIVFGKIF